MDAEEIVKSVESLLNKSIRGKHIYEWMDANVIKILEDADIKGLELLQKNVETEYKRLEPRVASKSKEDEFHPLIIIPATLYIAVAIISVLIFIPGETHLEFIRDLALEHLGVSFALAKILAKVIPALIMMAIGTGLLKWIFNEIIELPDIIKNKQAEKAVEEAKKRENPIRITLDQIHRVVTDILDEKTKSFLSKQQVKKNKMDLIMVEYPKEKEFEIISLVSDKTYLDYFEIHELLSKLPVKFISGISEDRAKDLHGDLIKLGARVEIRVS